MHTDAWFAILGPLEVRRDGRLLDIGGRRLRTLLALLLLAPGRTVPTETLIAGVWADSPPGGVGNALQALVSRLRSALGADRGLLVAGPAGYRLSVAADRVDAHRFTGLAAAGRAALDAGDAERAAVSLRRALGLWRGPALPELSGNEVAAAEIARLEQLRLAAIEDGVEAELRLGVHDGLVAEITRLVTAHPLRERLRGQLMRALYESGRHVEALAAYEAARAEFAERLGADPSPELAELHVSMLRREYRPPGRPPARVPVDAPAPAAPTGPAPPRRAGNLPARLTSFVGREREVAQVGRLLAERRLVTLVGPGGAGKTRLAVECADAAAARAPDGVWLVELAPVRDAVEVPQAVLAALGLREMGPVAAARAAPRPGPPHATDGGDPLDRLVAQLAGRTLLLVLDNCEHLVDAAARLVDRLLAECPGVRVLATGREPLGITGETLFTVPPLEPPPPGERDVRHYPAVRLFLDRAAGVRPGRPIADLAPVARICRALDGLPLAIELAAARLRSLSAEQIADRLGDRFRLLTGGSRTALPRHQTLRAVVEWSWELLDADERRLARRLAVFPGGATLEAVEAVCAGGGLAAGDVLDVLARLVDKSLVVMAERDGVPRYSMLETIRAYAAGRLAEAGEEERYRLAHARHFLELARTAEPYLRRHEQVHWLGVLSGEHDNLTGALHWAVRTGWAGLAAEFAATLLWYWWLVGHRAEGARWAGDVLRLVAETGARVDPQALALLHVGYAVNGQGAGMGVDEVRESLTEAARLGREHGHRNALSVFAEPIMAVMTRDEHTERPLADLVEHEDPWVRGLARMFLGYLWLSLGRVAEAEPEAEAALRLFRETGDRWGIGMCLSILGDLHLLHGDPRRATAVYQEVLELIETMRAPEELPYIRFRLAQARYAAGAEPEALAHLAEAERMFRELRDHGGLGLVDHVRGDLARWRGDLEEARQRYAAAASAMTDSWLPEAQQTSLLRLSLLHLALAEDDLARAERLLREALEPAVASLDGPVLAYNAVGAAAVALARGEPESAALLLGAGHRLRGSDDPANPDCARALARARAALGPRFDAAYERGRTIPRDDALALLQRLL